MEGGRGDEEGLGECEDVKCGINGWGGGRKADRNVITRRRHRLYVLAHCWANYWILIVNGIYPAIKHQDKALYGSSMLIVY